MSVRPEGYVLDFSRGVSHDGAPTWSARATPIERGITGSRSFATDGCCLASSGNPIPVGPRDPVLALHADGLCPLGK